MDKVTTVGIDLAKRVFALHGVNGVGRVTLRRICQRDELVAVIAQTPTPGKRLPYRRTFKRTWRSA